VDIGAGAGAGAGAVLVLLGRGTVAQGRGLDHVVGDRVLGAPSCAPRLMDVPELPAAVLMLAGERLHGLAAGSCCQGDCID
jgi:hypothetical protein